MPTLYEARYGLSKIVDAIELDPSSALDPRKDDILERLQLLLWTVSPAGTLDYCIELGQARLDFRKKLLSPAQMERRLARLYGELAAGVKGFASSKAGETLRRRLFDIAGWILDRQCENTPEHRDECQAVRAGIFLQRIRTPDVPAQTLALIDDLERRAGDARTDQSTAFTLQARAEDLRKAIGMPPPSRPAKSAGQSQSYTPWWRQFGPDTQ